MSRSPFLKLSPALAALTFALTASAAPSVSDSKVEFTAVGPAGLKINGTGDKVTAEKNGGGIKFNSSIANLKTGIGLRDKHLKGYIHADKHGTATMSFDEDSLKKLKAKVGDGEAEFKDCLGKFTMNGVEKKPKSFTCKIKKAGGSYAVNAQLKVLLTDHKIEIPCYLGVCVEDEISVKVSFKTSVD